MSLRDDEQRRLAEIERRLSEEDPHLARRLATLRPFGPSRVALGIAVMVVSLVAGLVIAALGSELNSVPVGIVGVALAIILPTVLIWRLWLRKL